MVGSGSPTPPSLAGLSHAGLSLSGLSLSGLALILTLSGPAAMAAPTDDGEDSGEIPATEITVTAPRPAGVPQERATGAETTITAQDIEDQQMRRLDDALELVPGLTLGGQRNIGQPQAIRLRGLGPRNTRVFIDGIEVSDTSRAQSQYLTGDHTIADIERIEVLRGARPGRFGADNGGGVINIVTKRPTGPLSGEAGVEYGSYNTKRLNAMVSGAAGPVDARLAIGGTHTDGFSDFNEDRGGDEDDPFWSLSVSGRVGLQVTENLRFDVVGRYLREHIQWDYSFADTDGITNQTERFLRASATLEMLDDSLVHTLGVADSLSTRSMLGAGRNGVEDTFDGGKTRIDYVATWAVLEGVTLELGGDAINERMEQDVPYVTPQVPRMEDDFWRGGAFLTLGVTPAEGLDLSASLRGDAHDDHGSKITYRLGAAYTVAPTGTTLRGSYATAWQTPSLYEMHDPCYGNADLRPETSQSWDIGVDQSLLDDRMRASVTYFEARTQDQINWQYAPPKPRCQWGGTYVNIDEVFSQGVELALTARPLPDVDVSIGYTWQNAIDRATDKRLDNIPVNQGTASVTWRFLPEATANVGLRYRDRTTGFGAKSDESWTADIRLAYDLTDTVTLHGRVENLFDAQYEDVAGYGTPGQSFYGGVTVRF